MMRVELVVRVDLMRCHEKGQEKAVVEAVVDVKVDHYSQTLRSLSMTKEEEREGQREE